MPSSDWGFVRKVIARTRLMLRLRRARYDTLVYLAPSIRGREQVKRDIQFFRLAGCHRIFGARHFPTVPRKKPGVPFPKANSEADLLLARLAADEISVPAKGQGSIDMCLGDNEAFELERWRSKLGSDGGRTWIGVGPGSKMPAKRWPLERFGEVVSQLIARHDIWPVIFGGPEDKQRARCSSRAGGAASMQPVNWGCARRPSR